AAAGGPLRRLFIHPMRDAAAVEAVGRPHLSRDLGVIAPFPRARAGIERDHLVERRAEDQAVFYEERRRLELGLRHDRGRPADEITRAEFPGAHELIDIAWRDLGEVGEPRAAGIGAPMIPRKRGPRG